MRIFVAVEPPRPLQDAVADAAKELLGDVREARLIRPPNLHVTVRFLGDVEDARVPEVVSALGTAAATCCAGAAHMRDFGAFPSASQPRVVWAGVDDAEQALTGLEAAVSAHLEPLGFQSEQRPFHPHVTVARLRRPLRGARGRRLAAAIAVARDLGPFPVRAVALIKSRLTAKGAQYTVLESFPLTGPSDTAPPPSPTPTSTTTDTPSEAEPGTGEPR